MQFIPLQDHIYSIFRYDDQRIIGLIINPANKKVKIDTNRFAELTSGKKHFIDVLDGRKKKWKRHLQIPPVGFRIIEFED